MATIVAVLPPTSTRSFMSRDALLVILALVVLLNLTMLLQAALVLRRRSSAVPGRRRVPAAQRHPVARRSQRAAPWVPAAFPAARAPRSPNAGPPSFAPIRQPLIAAAEASEPRAKAAATAVRRAAATEQPAQRAEQAPPVPAQPVAARPVAAAEPGAAALPAAEPLTPQPVAEVDPGADAPEAAESEASQPAPSAPEPVSAVSAPEPVSAVSAPEPVSAEPSRKSPAKRSQSARGTPKKSPGGSRGRRFVLPPLDEDHARSARAIEAFLGGPTEPAAATTERPSRRRHRARRPAGTPAPKTTLVVSLKGYAELERAMGATRATTVSVAFGDALRRSARSTDELRELGGGRLRIVVEADDAGANAYLDRARASTQPWLELLPVPLHLDVGQRKSEVIPFDGARRIAGG